MTRGFSRAIREALSLVALTVLVACQSNSGFGGQSASKASPDSGEPAAVLNGRTITLGELDQYIMDQLFDRATRHRNAAKLYELRSDTLEQWLDQRALEDAASHSGLEAREFLEREAAVQDPIPEAEIRAHFDANPDRVGGKNLEEMAPRIRTFLEQEHQLALVAKLREDAGAKILLEPGRAQVAAIGPSRGPQDAAITIIGFSDFECPYCRRVVGTMHAILERYPEDVRFVFRHLPLDRIHARARPAAEAAMCAHAMIWRAIAATRRPTRTARRWTPRNTRRDFAETATSWTATMSS